jgi:hypothetical protein
MRDMGEGSDPHPLALYPLGKWEVDFMGMRRIAPAEKHPRTRVVRGSDKL